MVYKFREGSPFHGDAKATYESLERIRVRDGALKTVAILDEARGGDPGLHPHFPWDDALAARQLRLEIARKLARSIVVVKDGDSEPTSVYVHVPAPTAREGTYERLEFIDQHPDQYLSALAEARQKLTSAQRGFDELLSIAKASKAGKDDVARIMVAVQALQTANQVIQTLH